MGILKVKENDTIIMSIIIQKNTLKFIFEKMMKQTERVHMDIYSQVGNSIQELLEYIIPVADHPNQLVYNGAAEAGATFLGMWT